MPQRIGRDSLILIFFVALKFLLQYVLIHPAFDLHRDEYLHLDQARHLAWGYESVPPLTSWLSYLILLSGNHEWLVKFFPALFGSLTLVIVWKLTAALTGTLFAKVVGAIAITFSAILRINILYQPNSFDILCWTALYASVALFILYDQSKWLYAAAICFALGFLNKYNIVFLIAGLAPALLLSKHRKIFSNKHLYGAMLVALLMIAPNIVWQYRNDFPVIGHMKVLAESQLVNVNRSDFMKEQLLFFLPSVHVLVAGLVSFFLYRPFKPFKFLAYAFTITLLVFLVLKAKSYYAIGLYPVFLAFGSTYIEQWTKTRPLVYLRPVFIALIVILGMPLLKIGFPIYPPQQMNAKADMYRKLGMLRWEDGKEHALPQDFADMLGWKELADKVDDAQSTLGDDQHTLILTDNYGQAGAINYYSKRKLSAVSYNADYKNWFDLNREYLHVISIKEREDHDETIAENKKDFDTIYIAGKITEPLARENGTIIYVFKNARINISDTLRKDLRKANIY